VGKLGAAGFLQKGSKVFRGFLMELFFGESPAPQKGGSIGQVLLPFFDPEKPLIKIPPVLPWPDSKDPAMGVKTPQRYSHNKINYPHVDNEPDHEIDKDRPQSG
jgi:hypothetical protein